MVQKNIKNVYSKEEDKIQTKKVEDLLEKKILPTKFEKEILPANVVKGKVHKEIIRTSVLKKVVRNSVHPEVERKSVLKTTIRHGPSQTSTTVGEDLNLGEQSTSLVANAGIETPSFGVEGGDNEGTVGYGTSVIQGINTGATLVSQNVGGAFNMESENNRETSFPFNENNEEGGFGVEGGDNEGTVGYGTSVIQGVNTASSSNPFQTKTASVFKLPSVPSNDLSSTINSDFLPGPFINATD